MPTISDALAQLDATDFAGAASRFFDALGLRSDKIETLPTGDAAGFAAAFGHAFTQSALTHEWEQLELLFQLTADELSGQLSLENYDRERFDSFLFFALDLKGDNYSRGQLAGMARELNKPFPMPVIALFRYGGRVTLASLHRRENKRDAGRDVLERVVLLKDIELRNPHRAHVDILGQLANIKAKSWDEFLGSWNAVLDISELNRKFYRDYKLVFETVEEQVRGIESAEAIRDWTQRLFNRLLFLRFLEKKGWLQFNGSHDYLRALWEAPRETNQNFLNDRLYWTFFRGLNVQGEDRAIHALPALVERRGHVPFLNGGLFDLQDEFDVKGAVTFADEPLVFGSILGLFERYVFTVAENTPLEEEVGVDPEMLGKVFEELTNERTASGSYYTPRVVVAFMAREALKGYLAGFAPADAIEAFVEEGDAGGLTAPEEVLGALKTVRVCDPACGSGAYLLGMMQELLRLRDAVFVSHKIDDLKVYDKKLEIIEANLYGSDLMGFAVNIAMLRLWLSLVVEYNGPLEKLPALPNLQYKIAQGDSLLAPDPTDKGKVYHAAYLPLAQELAALHKEWFEESYRRSRGEAARAKSEIKADIESKMSEIAGVIGKASAGAHDWRLRFAEVFAGGGFDIVIANPPYGASVAEGTRDAYFARAPGEAQSKDTYGLFMARGLQLLKSGGWFTFIVSDTWRTIKSHRPLRRRLLEQASVAHVLDLPSWIFGATVNTGILTFRKGAPDEQHGLVAADLRALAAGDWNGLGEQLRAVARAGDDRQSLTLARYSYRQSLIATYDNASFFIAAPALYALMSDPQFRPLGEVAQVKQGLATADNEYYLRKRAGARGSYAILEESLLLSEAQIAALTPDEKAGGVDPARYEGRCFVPYDKGGASDAEGGWMPNYHVPTEYFIDWSNAAVNDLKTRTLKDIKTRKGELHKIRQGDENSIGSRFQNQPFYFKLGLSYSPTGEYSPTFRLGTGAVFGNKGSTIFAREGEDANIRLWLAFLVAMLTRYLLKNYCSHTVETGEEVLTRLPLPRLN